jgi:hypothetical protein
VIPARLSSAPQIEIEAPAPPITRAAPSVASAKPVLRSGLGQSLASESPVSTPAPAPAPAAAPKAAPAPAPAEHSSPSSGTQPTTPRPSGGESGHISHPGESFDISG